MIVRQKSWISRLDFDKKDFLFEKKKKSLETSFK